MNKLIALCLTAAGFAVLPVTAASAHEAPASATAVTAAASLPPTARVNFTVAASVRGQRHYRTVRRVYIRHGRRVVVYRRVYY